MLQARDGNNLVHPTAMRRALESFAGENVTNSPKHKMQKQ